MLRAAVALLLLANVLFFVWAGGWAAPWLVPPRAGEHEPERVAAQIHPERVTVLAPRAASAAVTAAVSAARTAAAACLETGPLAEADLAAAEAALVPAQLPAGAVVREAAAAPPWAVLAPRTAEPAQRRARQAELRQMGLDFEVLPASMAGVTPEVAGAWVLSRHADRADAEEALARLRAAPTGAASAPPPVLKALRVTALPPAPPQRRLRMASADAEQAARLQALSPAALAGGFRPCAARP